MIIEVIYRWLADEETSLFIHLFTFAAENAAIFFAE